jgi:hypothetical protein
VGVIRGTLPYGQIAREPQSIGEHQV